MRAVVVAALVACSGCYVEPAYVQVAPMRVAPRVAEPPPAVDVFYEPRPGYVFVNGRYVFAGGAWAWQRGYYVPDRPGFVYVQGYWAGGRWLDGRWERERPGFLHTGGAWEPRGRGYVWRPGRRIER